MSKLIVNTGTLAAGGAERVLSVLSKPFADAFDEVQYVMWLDAKYPDIFYDIDPRVKIVRLSQESGSTKTWRQMLWYRQYVKRERPDVVMTFMIALCFTVTCSLVFSGAHQVVALRNDPFQMRRKWLRRLATWSFYAPDVKGILVQTEAIRRFFESKKGLLKKTEVIYNPIVMDKQLVGAAVNAPKESTIVAVGRLSRQKQPWILIKAFQKFSQSHPSYKLIFYGEGELRQELLLLAARLGIADKVKLPGRSKDVVKDILSARIWVMTSMCEGMSNALMEAMCVGLPCISTKVSGATDLIKDGENGFLVDIEDVEAVAERLKMLADNEKLCNTIGRRAALVYEKLSDETIGQVWVDYLRGV